MNESIGNFQSIKKSDNGILLTAENGFVEVTVFSKNIFRISIARTEKELKSFSYAVLEKPLPVKYKISDSKHKIEIFTGELKLLIDKNPLRFSFFNKKNQLINADDAFGTAWIGNEVTTYKKLQINEKFIGLGEKNGNLNRKGECYTNWNTDHFAYPVNFDPLYCSTPFFMGINNILPYGIFLDNTHKTFFDFASSNERFISFSADDGVMNYYFIHHETISEIIKSYTWLTGRMELPPLWSLGFQQARYSYYPDTEVLSIAKKFREKNIPCDTIYLDIHYMDAFKIFTWHPAFFPTPEKLIADLKELGFNLVVILDPGVKRENNYHVYEEGKKKNHFVKFPNGDEFAAQVWPGLSCFPDFTREETRKWWGEKLNLFCKMGIEGFWNDMNEPTALGKHLPDLIEFFYEGEKATHKKAKNIYGMQMARATYEGVKKNLMGKRLFSLTRAGFSGVQRYAAVWTGDNISSDEHLLAGVRLLNSMGLAGISFCGYDAGGFAGEATSDLFARWISLGAFSPMFRCHSMINTRNAEPWAFGEEVEDISRNYIQLRYQLIPYIYSCFYESSGQGLPVQRSLAIDFFSDEKIFNPDFQNQYLFGKAFLIAPMTSKQEIAKIYLPDGRWFDFFTGKLYEGKQEVFIEAKKEKLPVFVKAGSIVPMQTSVPNLKEKPRNTLLIHLYNGADGEFEYYEDDGTTYQYQNDFFYIKKIIFYFKSKKLFFERPVGKFPSHFKTIKVLFHGFENSLNTFFVNGKKVKPKNETVKLLSSVHHFEYYPQSINGSMPVENVKTIEFKNDCSETEIKWK